MPADTRCLAPKTGYFALLIALVAAGGFALTSGAYPVALDDILRLFTGAEAADATASLVLWDIRMPRLVLGLLTGAVLAVAGALLQGLFRNPLADPGLIGVSSGAALAAVAVIVLGGSGWPAGAH